jgi:hypothetical protein
MPNDLAPPSGGAFIEQKYITRTKKVVPVDMSDLRQILQIDGWEYALSVAGQFFFVGGFWLGMEKFIEAGVSDDTRALLAICVVAAGLGALLFWLSWSMRRMKRNRILEIISETGDQI